ncbi:Protein kinase-like (PK-like) [Glarea lozoyensis ATCC 20868]|uniref:Protein kinase-like (PK-like) n=1 Tax=Glarea lozoyensis (strain ATCC 20868 / MF5171) TaxID=1116229 RepID=S3DX95_GLAL2|nr:Protein kinase-like (PK-like) [Glarea lozoyensis ATCC 20868]EPE30998.1 Protein kinase-like (PK-like) [Glarea lozoyensis ATCC 20868]
MPPFVDDTQRFPLVQAQLRPKDSNSNRNCPAGVDESAIPGQNNSDKPTESLYPLSLDIQVRRLLEHNSPADAASEGVAYDTPVVTNDSPNLILGSSDTFDGNSHFKQPGHNVSTPSRTEDSSNFDSSRGYESSSSLNPSYPTVVCSDCGLDIDDGDKDSASTSELPDCWSSDIESNSSGKRSKLPVVVPWNTPSVRKSEIPHTTLKPSKSDVSDSGDAYFYATQNATGVRASKVWPVLDDIDEKREKLALQDTFFEALVRPHEEKKGFFPRAYLSKLVTEDCVYEELTRCLEDNHNPKQIRAYARTICEESPQLRDEDDIRPPKIKSFKKIFAILVLIEKTSSILKFLDPEEGINDLGLPLRKLPKGANGSRFELRLAKNPSRKLECFRNWTMSSVKAFEEWQWTTVSPFFFKGSCKDVRHWPLQPSAMLPFTVDGQRGDGNEYRTEFEGGYSHVFKVEIHPEHHSFSLPRNQWFAIKRLNSNSKEDFKKEVEMLKMYSDDTRYPHLISLLATYEQFGIYYLIFPWADGDLNYFWSTLRPEPSLNMKTVKWFAKQCKGIAHGLLKIHHYRTSNSKCQTGSHHHPETHESRFGRHGDLKPENILWFSDSDGGTLKISDFGLSEYSTHHSKSYKPKSKVATSMSYRPPECDLTGGKIGQSYDIWTLGCLYLEFITWLLGGWELVKKFEKKRMSFDPMWCDMNTDTFFEIVKVHGERSIALAARVKPAVINFMDDLHAHENCTEFLHEFITMIKFNMLTVKPKNPEEKGRFTSDEIHVKLTSWLKEIEKPNAGLDYACKPAPRHNFSQNCDDVVEIDVTDTAPEVLSNKRFPTYDGPVQERSYPSHLSVPESPRRRGRNRSFHDC